MEISTFRYAFSSFGMYLKRAPPPLPSSPLTKFLHSLVASLITSFKSMLKPTSAIPTIFWKSANLSSEGFFNPKRRHKEIFGFKYFEIVRHKLDRIHQKLFHPKTEFSVFLIIHEVRLSSAIPNRICGKEDLPEPGELSN